jgi:hypothetical protein
MSTSSGLSGSANIQLNTLANWTEVDTGDPLGTHGGYVIAVDYGTTNEEKIYVPQGVTGASLTGVTRGYDNTQIRQHTNLTTQVVVVFSATEFKESNSAVGAVANLLKGTASANPAPADITRSTTGLQGTSVVAAAANHTHTLPDSIVEAIIDSPYITNALDAAGYVQNIVTSAYVTGKFPAARLYNSGNQAIGASTATTVSLATVDYSKNGIDTATANTIKITTAGVYRVTGYLHWAATPTANWYARIFLNGSSISTKGLSGQYNNYPASANSAATISFDYQFAANDLITLNILTANAQSIDAAFLSVSLVTL